MAWIDTEVKQHKSIEQDKYDRDTNTLMIDKARIDNQWDEYIKGLSEEQKMSLIKGEKQTNLEGGNNE